MNMKTSVQGTVSPKKSKLSIHPKVAAVGDILVGIGLILFFGQMLTAWWMLVVWFLVRLVWWVGIIRIVYYTQGIRRIDHLRSLLIFNIGICAVLLFVDWSINWYVWGLLFTLGSALSFWFLPTWNSELSFVGKPHTRWCFVITLLGLAGAWAAGGGVVTFYSWWLWMIAWLVLTVWTVMVSIWWWRQYDAPQSAITKYWALAMGVSILQVSGVILWWPVGFLFTGSNYVYW
jgi:hypothetical protein